jgi:hypothetical protein
VALWYAVIVCCSGSWESGIVCQWSLQVVPHHPRKVVAVAVSACLLRDDVLAA